MKLLTFFVKWNDISITRLSLFHHFEEWNDIISSLVFRFISWLMTRLRLVTCHEMKLKTREEMMSFHSTKWWNNSRLVMKYHFIPQKMSAIVHFSINSSKYPYYIQNVVQCFLNMKYDLFYFRTHEERFCAENIPEINWWFRFFNFGMSVMISF